jgi:transposase
MGTFRTPADRQQITCFPPTIDEYVPQDDSVRYVDALVDELDLSAIELQYSSFGRPGYEPRILVKVLLYGKMRGIRSSRALSQATRENVRFMWLSSAEKPDFRTISDFRKRFHRELSGLLKQTIRIGIETGVIQLDHVAVDGTVLRAYAGARTFYKPEQLEKVLGKLEAGLDESFRRDIALDEEEDQQYGGDDGDKPLPKGMDKKNLKEKIQAALAHHKKVEEGRKEKGKRIKQVSLTDPESRFMHSSNGMHASYNGQAAVDAGSRMVVGGYATNAVSDNGELPEVLKDIEANTGRNPKVLSADRGYSLKEGLEDLQKRAIDGYIPQRKEKSAYFKQEDFQYEAETDTYRCPQGQVLRYRGVSQNKRKKWRTYVCADCRGCTLAKRCFPYGKANRTLCVSVYSDLYYEMREKTRSPRGKQMARIRSSTVEPMFGHLKANRSLRQLYYRGVAMIDSMWKLELTAYNIEKLIRALPPPARVAPASP